MKTPDFKPFRKRLKELKKENKKDVRTLKKIPVDKQEMLIEHKRLIRILEKGTIADRREEAWRQKQELLKYK